MKMQNTDTRKPGAIFSFIFSGVSACVMLSLCVALLYTKPEQKEVLKMAFVGDVMIGRGIDFLWEIRNPIINSSDNNEIEGEQISSAIKSKFPNRRVPYDYVWGNMLPYIRQADVKLANLECVITTEGQGYPGKPYIFRVHPSNLKPIMKDLFQADFLALANNHMMDFSGQGVLDTIKACEAAGIAYSGAGKNIYEARKPAVIDYNGFRIGVFGMSNQPLYWAATENETGINFVYVTKALLVPTFFAEFSETVKTFRAEQNIDLVVVSIHWGKNWKMIPPANYNLWARRMIDECGVDIIHGHSSHTIQGIEVYKNKLIMYSNGNFVDDYSSGASQPPYQSDFKPHLGFLYTLNVNMTSRKFINMELIPSVISNYQVNRAGEDDTKTIFDKLNTLSISLDTSFTLDPDGIVRYQFTDEKKGK